MSPPGKPEGGRSQNDRTKRRHLPFELPFAYVNSTGSGKESAVIPNEIDSSQLFDA